MKICMITTSEIYHDTRILNEASSLSESHKVTVLARRYPDQKSHKHPFIVKQIDYPKISFFQINIFLSLFSLARAAFRENPDIYHAHDLDGLLCAFLSAFLKRKILIYDSHELWSDMYPFANLRGIRWFLPLLEKLLIWRVRSGITVNRSLAGYLSRKYGKKFISLYNVSVCGKKKKSLLNLREKFPDKKIILHLGAADEGRGMEQMIAAAKFLPQNYIVVFIGGGKTETQAKILTQKLGLKNIYFFPAVAPNEMLSTIAQADLGLALTQKISLSYYYSLPNKIFQYLAAKVPVLGSNFPEFKKIISKNGLGEVVDPAKPTLIAQKIIEMTKTRAQKQYRHRLEGLAKNKYNWEVEGQKLLNFYEKI